VRRFGMLFITIAKVSRFRHSHSVMYLIAATSCPADKLGLKELALLSENKAVPWQGVRVSWNHCFPWILRGCKTNRKECEQVREGPAFEMYEII